MRLPRGRRDIRAHAAPGPIACCRASPAGRHPGAAGAPRASHPRRPCSLSPPCGRGREPRAPGPRWRLGHTVFSARSWELQTMGEHGRPHDPLSAPPELRHLTLIQQKQYTSYLPFGCAEPRFRKKHRLPANVIKCF